MMSEGVIELFRNAGIGAGATVTVLQGGSTGATFATRNANVQRNQFMGFYLYADAVTTLLIEVGQNLGGIYRALVNVVVPAATLFTPYSLPPPMNTQGYLVMTAPIVRVRLTDGGAGSATCEFYGRVWGA